MLFVAAGQANVMDYFSERSNPFYERTCNNEILKMQKLGVADVQLQNMQVGHKLGCNQCYRSGSVGSVCFWTSWIRIHYLRGTGMEPDSDPSVIKQK
jgi:hypothetical protein